MGRKSKYSKVLKMQACEDYEKGIGTTKEVVRRWYLKFKKHGLSIFLGEPAEKSHKIQVLR